MILLALILAAGTPHPVLTRPDLDALLRGRTIETGDNGAAAYTFGKDGTLQFRGTMNQVGTGTWEVTGKSEVTLMLWDKTFVWSDCWGTSTGLLACKRGRRAEPHSTWALDGTTYDNARIVRVVAAGANPAPIVQRLIERGYQVVLDPTPAKATRTTSEVWWSNGGPSRYQATQIAEALVDLTGTMVPREWTFGGPPYTAIVVVGPRGDRADGG